MDSASEGPVDRSPQLSVWASKLEWKTQDVSDVNPKSLVSPKQKYTKWNEKKGEQSALRNVY